MGGGVFPFVFPYLNHLKWWFPSRDVGETVKSCRIHSSVTPGFLVAVHFANVQRPAASDIQNVCIYNMCKPCYLLITSFQVTFNPSYFAGTLTFSGFFHKSPCRLLVASTTSNSFTNVRPKRVLFMKMLQLLEKAASSGSIATLRLISDHESRWQLSGELS